MFSVACLKLPFAPIKPFCIKHAFAPIKHFCVKHANASRKEEQILRFF